MWGFSRRGFPELGLGLRVPATKGMKVGLKKTRVPGLPVDENGVILGLLVLTHYQRVTDRQTDTTPIAKSRSSTDECDKNRDNF